MNDRQKKLRDIANQLGSAARSAADLAQKLDKGAGVIAKSNFSWNPFRFFASSAEAKAKRRDAAIKYVKTPLTEEQRHKDNLQVFLWSAGMLCGDYSEGHLKRLVLEKNKDVLSEDEYKNLAWHIHNIAGNCRYSNILQYLRNSTPECKYYIHGICNCHAHPYDVAM